MLLRSPRLLEGSGYRPQCTDNRKMREQNKATRSRLGEKLVGGWMLVKFETKNLKNIKILSEVSNYLQCKHVEFF